MGFGQTRDAPMKYFAGTARGAGLGVDFAGKFQGTCRLTTEKHRISPQIDDIPRCG
jgi:hypothetical protein